MTDEFYGGVAPETKHHVDEQIDEGNEEIGYSDDYDEPLYAAEILTPEEAETHIKRHSDFHVDEFISKNNLMRLSDYRHSGYDRGHLVPSADSDDEESMHDTYTLANMVPEVHEMNAGIWKRIEDKCRELAEQYGDLYIVTGAIFNDKDIEVGKLVVPPYVYKSVTIPSLETKGVFVAPNNKSGQYEIMSAPDFYEKFGIKPQQGNHFPLNKSIFEL